MTANLITRILDNHGITHEQRESRILAHEVFTAPADIDLAQLGNVVDAAPVSDDPTRILVSALVDITDWTRTELLSWLGY